MASFKGHIAFSTALGAAYGGLAAWQGPMDWGPAVLGAGLAALGGMLPDLDSQSGVPVRELSGLSAAMAPFLLFRRFQHLGFSLDQTLVLLAGVYLVMRYGVAAFFRTCTVHRGMFHSVPGMLIAGLVVFHLYHHPDLDLRLFLGTGVMLGFLSHLVLDELCSVDFSGARIKLHKSAGSALKFFSSSFLANLTTYCLLAGLVWVAGEELQQAGLTWPAFLEQGWDYLSRLMHR
jgi:hypothetical protein